MVLKKGFPVSLFFILPGLLVVSLASQAAGKGAPVSEPAAADITNRLDRIEQLLQSQGLLDMLQRLESLQTELQRLRGELEVQSHTLEQMKKQQRDLYTDLDRRMQRLESGTIATTKPPDQAGTAGNPPLETLPAAAGTSGPAISPSDTVPDAQPALTVETTARPSPPATRIDEGPAVQPPAETAPAQDTETTAPDDTMGTPATTTSADPAREKADYQKAFSLLKQAQYAQAIKEFDQYLNNYPTSQYADNAQYWKAEANYVTQQYESAIKEYEKLVVQYPDSQKVTHAQLKIGYCYYELGQLNEAQRRLEDLKQRYPDTTAGRLAEEKLKQIKLAPQ